ncbi:hypothetical protein BDA96_07G144300 [Sorghum bicolor]|uniref:Uncharacterized protein n=1 Tax=Sorghum bicolor TaxID=4558 RepID=A0A921QKQ4_SORBI|nr:hypothetical protein BDA96_07G144300 [Sorghum bicolor]
MWLAGGWIELGLLATCVVTKLRFGIGGAWGGFSADVSPTASCQPRCWVSTAASFKALMRWAPSVLGWPWCLYRQRQPATAAVGGDV